MVFFVCVYGLFCFFVVVVAFALFLPYGFLFAFVFVLFIVFTYCLGFFLVFFKKERTEVGWVGKWGESVRSWRKGKT